MPENSPNSGTDQKSGLSLSRIIRSTLAGAIGVQSNKNREEDFKNGNIWVYIVSGIIFTALFILTITTVVKIALSAA